ncbi:MAG: heme exporter protein CcmD [Rhodospirillaceae bacterium]|nr:heme exporter protein CcmD [Rhodospirillaceae bacterium]MBL6930943.1 heme exporter protein CcmD [Rhodospirillales bacterium]MBL6942333.1 heme exporter protein CcmD [Rhodospirillales bacterium]
MIKEFLDMGGYGAYIWPSYGVTAVVMIVMLVTSLRGLRENEVTLQSLEVSTKDKPE